MEFYKMENIESYSNTQSQPEPKKLRIKRDNMALRPFQVKELLESASRNTKHLLLIKTMLGLGLRVSEATNLIISDLNFTTNKCHIRAHNSDSYVKSFKPKTDASTRRIDIDKTLAKELKFYIGNRKRGYVFLSQATKTKFHTNNVIAIVNRYAKISPSINKTCGSHALRRTYASHLLNENVVISDISKNLGHSKIKTTMIYLRSLHVVDEKNVRKALKTLIPKINVKERA